MQIFPLIDPYAVHADGSRPLTADWDAGSYKITAQQLESDIATGTAPLIVASTTVVSNLNADLLDGQEGSYYAVSGGAEHDGFSDYVANEHIDWTGANGKNIVLNTGTASITGPNGANDTDAADVLTIVGGKGGPATSTVGGAGGGVAFTGGAGGDISGGSVAGAGGSIAFTGGKGGLALSGCDAPGDGGNLQFTGGMGGDNYAAMTAASGGNIIIKGGTGGYDYIGDVTAGDGGDVFLDSGDKGIGSVAADGAYGRVVFRRAGVEKITFNANDGGHLMFADSVRLRFGAGADLSLYHDGSNSHIVNATGILNITDSGSGIKIGTATSELLGFYGVTPVNQPDTISDPSGGTTIDAEARTAVNTIIDRLQELGLVA